MLLRFTGTQPVTFPSIGAEVFPGDEFEVPDDIAGAFTARADIDPAATTAPRARRPAKAVDATPAPADASTAPAAGQADSTEA